VLFLGRQNTAVSIMAEAILRQVAQERVRAASAGESVAGPVNSHALDCLRAHGIATEGLQSKAWGEFFGLNRDMASCPRAECARAALADLPL
jgi:arsenate reductase